MKVVNLLNKINKKARISAFFIVATLILGIIFWSLSTAKAADPGHGAGVIGPGAFESGNYAFPNNLTIGNNLLVGGNNLFVNNATGYVGIGTTHQIISLLFQVVHLEVLSR